MLKSMEGQSGLSELSVISWVAVIQGCLLSGVPLYSTPGAVGITPTESFGFSIPLSL